MLHNLIDNRTDRTDINCDARMELHGVDHRNELYVDLVPNTTIADAAMWAQLRFICPVTVVLVDRGSLEVGDVGN